MEEYFAPLLQGIANLIEDHHKQIALVTTVTGDRIIQAVHQDFALLRDYVQTSTQWLDAALGERIVGVRDDIFNYLITIPPDISREIHASEQRIKGSIEGTGREISESITALIDRFLPPFLEIPRVIPPGIERAATPVVEKLNELVKVIDERVVPELEESAKWTRIHTLLWSGGAPSEVLEIVPELKPYLTPGWNPFEEALKAFIEWILDQLGWMGEKISEQVQDKVIEPLWDTISGTADWYGEQILAFIEPVQEKIKTGLTGSPEEALEEALEIVGLCLTAAMSIEFITTVVELLFPFKYLGVGGAIGSATIALILGPIVAAIIGAIIGPSVVTTLRYGLQEMFTPWIPDRRDLVEATMRGVMSIYEYKSLMKKHGLKEDYAELILKKEFRVPGFSELREMLWRDIVPNRNMRDALRYSGYLHEWVERYMQMIWKIPPISDLIRFVVREVITPDEFYTLAKMQGMPAVFTKYYWDAHWVLPPPERTWDAFLRGIITEDAYRKFLVWYDYSPEPRPGIGISDVDIMLGTQWDLPGAIETRWMWEWGIIDDEGLLEILKLRGMHPDWREKVAAGWRGMLLREEIMGLVRTAISDFRYGWITEDEFRERLEALGIPDRRIEYYLSRAEDEWERWYKEELVDIYTVAFRQGVISTEEFREALLALGMREERVDAIVWLEELRKSPKRKS